MNTFHRFFVTGVLTGLSFAYASAAAADQMYQQQPYHQQKQQQQQPNQKQQYQQQPRERSYGEKIGKKALNGFVNIPTAPLEIPRSVIRNMNAEGSNVVFGLVGGLFEGSLNTIFRVTTGVMDLSTFFIPTKAIVNPQYVWDDFYDTNSTYGDIFRLDVDEQQPKYDLPQE